jgi:UDP-glucuronate decarboxylase
MRILVAGSSGFLGTNLVLQLLKEGHEVTGIDNFLTGSKANNTLLLRHPRYKFIEHDVREPFRGKFNLIYNLACPASPPSYQLDPVGTITTAFIGTKNLLDLALENSAILIQASTSEVYGDPLETPQKESYLGNVNTIGIRACYDEGKRAAETLCADYKRQYGLDTRIVRIFNTYGPYMSANDGRVVSNFIVQAIKSNPISIYGDGSQTRSFCFVDDLVEALIKTSTIEEYLIPINLGNPSEFAVSELANLVKLYTKSSSEIIFEPLPLDDPKQRKPDISRAMSILGWLPKISLDEGLRQTIKYFRTSI